MGTTTDARRSARAAAAALALLHAAAAHAVPEQVAAGSQVLWLRSDGTVWASGDRGAVRGDPGEEPRVAFARIPGLKGVVTVAVASDSAAAIDVSGMLWLWGDLREILGAGGEAHVPAPFLELGPVSSVALGMDHGIATGRDGKVRTFGRNDVGQLGVSGGDSSEPRVVAGFDDVVQVAAADFTSLMLRRDGTVWGMGSAFFGLLGKNGKWDPSGSDTTPNPRPVRIEGLEDVRAIAVGSTHGLALDGRGRVHGWGNNGDAQLASPPDDDLVVRSPFVLPGLGDVVAIAARDEVTLALRSDGTVLIRGNEVWHRFGGTEDGKGALAPVPGLAHVEAIFAGPYNAFARTPDRGILGWGANHGSVGGFCSSCGEAPVPPTRVEVAAPLR